MEMPYTATVKYINPWNAVQNILNKKKKVADECI